MILAKDLRLGNLYRYLHEESESIKVVDVDFLETQQAYDNDPDDERFSRGWWSDSIPLTEEWLLKFGFEKDDHLEDNWYFSKDGYISVLFNKTVWVGNNEFEISDMPVHRFQNLYFALTGEELQIIS